MDYYRMPEMIPRLVSAKQWCFCIVHTIFLKRKFWQLILMLSLGLNIIISIKEFDSNGLLSEPYCKVTITGHW